MNTPSRLALFTVALVAALGVLLTTLGIGEPGVREAVRWTARVSVLCLCLALAGEGLRWRWPVWTHRAEVLQALAISHTIHAFFVAALAVHLNGTNLVQRSSPIDVLGGALAYVFIFWGALKPDSRITSAGLFWVWGVFLVSYGGRALRMPMPFAFAVGLLILAVLVRVAGPWCLRDRRTATFDHGLRA